MTVEEARAQVGRSLGLSDFDGTPGDFAQLSPQNQERVSVATIAFVLQNPANFSSATFNAAKVQASKVNFGRLGDYAPGSFLDTAVQFVKAYGETAGNVIVGAAEVAGRSAKALGLNVGLVVAVLGIAAIAYFGAPIVLPRLKKALESKPSTT